MKRLILLLSLLASVLMLSATPSIDTQGQSLAHGVQLSMHCPQAVVVESVEVAPLVAYQEAPPASYVVTRYQYSRCSVHWDRPPTDPLNYTTHLAAIPSARNSVRNQPINDTGGVGKALLTVRYISRQTHKSRISPHIGKLPTYTLYRLETCHRRI